jgi:hypothetical protein
MHRFLHPASVLFLGVVFALAACGESTSTTIEGGKDAGAQADGSATTDPGPGVDTGKPGVDPGQRVDPGPPPAGCEDKDGDGVLGRSAACPQGKDCDDGDKAIFVGATEICGDGKDQDCDGDDLVCCLDEDGDGYGEGEKCLDWDCNDEDADVHPGAEEVCGDDVDQDCDDADAVCPASECTAESDTDGDGFGGGEGCDPKDCDDTDETVHPGAEEICGDEKDQNCDGRDEPCPAKDCKDEDGDGYGDGLDCLGEDCNDQDPDVNPGAPRDACGDGVDQDCSGADEDCPSPCIDVDGDSHSPKTDECPDGDDCNDEDASVHPGAEDICGDDTDQDCDGADAECPPVPCTKDEDCEGGMWCNPNDGSCNRPQVWEWWAPVVYVDTNPNGPGWDHFTMVDYDGNRLAADNGDHVDSHEKPGFAYYSFVRTDTHYYLGYFYYWPKRWSTFPVFPRVYENATRGVMLVVRVGEPGTYGTLEAMITTTEGNYDYCVTDGGSLVADSTEAQQIIKTDASSGHARPVVFADEQTHDIRCVRDWQQNGFPGDNGIVYRWGYSATTPDPLIDENARYSLISLVEDLWPDRNDIGDARLFDSFGHFAADQEDAAGLAPWALPYGQAPQGEILFDPASLVRRHWRQGWGTFHTRYLHNPYPIRVDLESLEIVAATDPGSAPSDPYINLYLQDGIGEPRRVLGATDGYQLESGWKKDDIYPNTILSMPGELGRFWFYGLEVPGRPLFEVEVWDRDSMPLDWGDDWLMEPEERAASSAVGQTTLDFVKSKLTVTVRVP